MELYRKKTNLQNKANPRFRDKYHDSDYSQPNEDQNSYLHQMLKKKAVSQPRNEALNLSTENLQNVRSSVEDILADENNKKKAIKYVIHIGKNRRNPNSSISYDEPRYQNTESPKRGTKPYLKEFLSSYKNSPTRTYDDQRAQSHLKKNKYISINDYTNGDLKKKQKSSSNKKANNYQNQEDTPNEYEMTSSNEEDQDNYNKNQEPKIMNRINR